jgi:hypothetical protein
MKICILTLERRVVKDGSRIGAAAVIEALEGLSFGARAGTVVVDGCSGGAVTGQASCRVEFTGITAADTLQTARALGGYVICLAPALVVLDDLIISRASTSPIGLAQEAV